MSKLFIPLNKVIKPKLEKKYYFQPNTHLSKLSSAKLDFEHFFLIESPLWLKRVEIINLKLRKH